MQSCVTNDIAGNFHEPLLKNLSFVFGKFLLPEIQNPAGRVPILAINDSSDSSNF